MANNVPKIRFNEFDDVWEEKKLGDLVTEFESGKSIKASDIHDNGSYPVYGGNGLRGYTETFNHNGDFTLIGRQGALSGNINFSTGKAFFTEHAVVVKANDTNNTKFLYYLMDNLKLGRWVTQSAQPGLAVGTLVAIHSSVPHYNEQTKIGTLFQTLDNQITLQQSELDQQREFKKTCYKKCSHAKE